MKFESFNLKKDLVKHLNELGYLEANAVQDKVIPKALRNENLIVKSETGSGKTHSFLIPILNKLDFSKGFQALIVSPTKELGLQTFNFLKDFKQFYPDLSIKFITSGIDINRNLNDLKKNAQIIICTPGRLVSLIQEEDIDFNNLSTIVLDEVDMLSGKDFFNDIENIISKLNEPQILAFSATISQKTYDFLNKNFKEVEFVDINGSINSRIKHHFINIKHKDIDEAILNFINNLNPYFLFIFASKKTDVKHIYQFLKEKKFKVGILSGDLEKRERKAMLKRVKNNEFQIVVCSDVASRGVDILDVTDVLSVDLPNNTEFYFHRAGRTGRNEKTGNSYIFYNKDSVDKMRIILKDIEEPIYLKFTDNQLVSDHNAVFNKKKVIKEDLELKKKIEKVSAKRKTGKVKPNYKKRRKIEIEKVVNKHKREKIKKEVRKELDKKYREEARKKR